MKATPRTLTLMGLALGVLVLAGGTVLELKNSPDYGRFGAPLDVDPRSVAAIAIDEMSGEADSAKRRLLHQIARQPTSVWVAGGADSARSTVADAVRGATKRGAVATLVAYNIPDRDCGGHSATTEAVEADQYRDWVDGFAAGLADARAIVIVEPDALAQLDCLDRDGQQTRLALLRYAVRAFAAAGAWVYLDAGHSGWQSAAGMANRLVDAGVASAAGFSVNVSNFLSTRSQVVYGETISQKLPSPAHFVIDTSRNGATVRAREWCNPTGAGLGRAPGFDTGSDLVDAYLWIKTPGLSDGACNGGPAAGRWWTDYAMELVKNAAVSVP